jgi:sulfur-carrier protein
MQLTILFFASLREALGSGREVVSVPPTVRDVAALRAWLMARGGVWQEVLAPGRAVRVAVDQTMAGEASALHEGAEIAFFPPVTGG